MTEADDIDGNDNISENLSLTNHLLLSFFFRRLVFRSMG
jgi:hypothetical protein